MTGIYRRILERIAREPDEILQRRISLPPWEKAWLAARSLAGVRA
jgi:15-cis-phytoene synthase